MGEDNAAKSYVRSVLLISFFLLLTVVGFNWFINPYGVWQSPKVHGVNEYVDVIGHARLYKMIYISRHAETECLLLGSSTVFKALYPARYEEITLQKTYNGGFSGARIDEIKLELEQAILFIPNLKKVVLGLNWFMFHEDYEGIAKEFPRHQVGKRIPAYEHVLAILCSIDALRDSARTIWSNIRGGYYSTIDCDGKMNANLLRLEYEKAHNLQEFAGDTVAQIPMFKDYRLSEQAIENYISIIKTCRTNEIDLEVYINPVHGIFLESIYTAGGGEKFEDWKRQLANIYPLYDFAHYHKVGSESFSLCRKYWRNTQHEMPLTGDLVLYKLAGKELPREVGEFGFFLTEGNVNEILEKERDLRNRWREENPETVSFVQGLVDRY